MIAASQRWQLIRQLLIVRLTLLIGMALLLIVVSLISIRTGAVKIPTDTIVKVLEDRAGFETDLDLEDRLIQRDSALILDIRLPRVIMAGLVGMGLALAGASLQGVFRNPLADPGLIGVSSGAAVGAVTAILIGIRDAQPLIAFITGILITLLVYRLAYRQRRTDTLTLLLTGLAINSIASAYIGMATFVAGQAEVGDIVFWTLGSVAGTFWADVELVASFVMIGAMGLPLLAKPLNLMALGETEARHLGVNVERLRLTVMGLSALMVGVGVAFVGIIGFVGLVVPHFMRLLFGPDHRWLLPASALGGAIFLMAFDLWARIVAVPTEVPLGVVTTLCGGPVFLFLIVLNQRNR